MSESFFGLAKKMEKAMKQENVYKGFMEIPEKNVLFVVDLTENKEIVEKFQQHFDVSVPYRGKIWVLSKESEDTLLEDGFKKYLLPRL